jgi:hypothetical protein
MKTKRIFVIVFVIVIVLGLIGFGAVSFVKYEATHVNPYFTNLSKKEKDTICHSSSVDLVKMYMDAIINKNYELASALLTDSAWGRYTEPSTNDQIKLFISSRYRKEFAEQHILPFKMVKKISGLEVVDVTNEPIIGPGPGGTAYKLDPNVERKVAINFTLEEGELNCPAPPAYNLTEFATLRKSSKEGCFLIDGFGTSP